MDIEYYDFSEHIDSIDWIQHLPNGLVSEQIDIRYNVVTVTAVAEGYEIYIAPKDPDVGWDGIFVRLDTSFQLIDYVVERLEPFSD